MTQAQRVLDTIKKNFIDSDQATDLEPMTLEQIRERVEYWQIESLLRTMSLNAAQAQEKYWQSKLEDSK